MLSHSYFILGPNGPLDIDAAAITQRHTIPLVWALLTGATNTRFNDEVDAYYFALNVDEALKVLDRGIAAWSYNNYFRTTLAPVSVFRRWLANNPPETPIYINVTELIRRSPTPVQDIESLKVLGGKVNEALDNIAEMEFTHYINDLRALAHPFITVPITGDRERDVYILTFEVRDTASVEAEMALQMVGVDRGKTLLREATASIETLLPKKGVVPHDPSPITDATTSTKRTPDEGFTVIYAPQEADLKGFFVDHLGLIVERETPQFLYLEAEGRKLKVVKLAKPIIQVVDAQVDAKG